MPQNERKNEQQMNRNSHACDAASQGKRIHADNHLPSSNKRYISNFNSTRASKAPKEGKDTSEISGNGKFTEYNQRRKAEEGWFCPFSAAALHKTNSQRKPAKLKDESEEHQQKISQKKPKSRGSQERNQVISMDSIPDHRRLEIDKSYFSVSSCESFVGPDKACPKQKSSIPAAPVNDLCGGALQDLEQQQKQNPGGDDDDIPTTAIAKQVHNLETVAYRCVLNALHARGPLHWRQEALLTDLRLSLHISDDEHRLELAQMRSAARPYSGHW